MEFYIYQQKIFGVVVNAYAEYSEESGLIIYTLEKLTKTYNEKAVENGYNSINTEGDNYKTLAYNLLMVNKNNRYGITDLGFQELVGTKYNTISFNELQNEFIVSSGDKYGIIDKVGNIKVNLIYDDISIINYSPLIYIVKRNNKYGVLNESGELITNVEYEEIGSKTDSNNKSERRVVIIPEISEEIKQSIVVKKESGYGLINILTGEPIVECDFERIYAILQDGNLMYEAVFKGQKVDLIQCVKALNTIVVDM